MITVLSRRYLLPVPVLAGLLAVAVASPLAQQQQPPRTVGTPGVDQLTVDFLAVAKDDARTPILDLTKEAITLKVGGKNRVITSLQLVKMEGPPAEAAAPAATAAPAASAFPAPFGTNVRAAAAASGPGRSVYFIIDTESLRPGEEGPVKTAMLAFLSKLTANDQVALMAVPHGGFNVELTSNLAAVRDAVTHFTGNSPVNETVAQAGARSRMDVEALSGMLRAMTGIDRPMTIVYIGSSLMGAGSTSSSNSTGSKTASDSLGAAANLGGGELTADDFNRVRELVGAARAQIFTIQTEGGATIANTSAGQANPGLQALASNGGEFYSHMALGDEDAIARIARATSAYYVATFDADPSDKVNNRYPIGLNTSRADVRILVRPDLERTKANAASTKVPSIDDMFKTSDAFRDLPMRAVGYSVRPVGPDKDKTTWVRAFAEIATPGTKIIAASAGLYDFTGRLVFRTAVPAAELAKPVMTAALQAQPGKYRLRFAATDGKTSGAVDYPIEVGLTPAGAFKMSSMMVLPKLQFSTETEAAALFELYGQNTGQQLSIELFLIGAGPEPKPLEPKINAVANEADKFIVGATIPLADLPPGDYQVKAIVGVVGQPSGTVTATIRKVK